MKKPTIAVVTCAKNEASMAQRWAATTDGADHKLWLVNGSDDDTLGAAIAAGITAHEAVIDPFRFDFARNIANALVPADIDIIIQLDADEVFSEPNWRRHFDANPDNDRWSYWLDSGGAPGWNRVIRANAHRRNGFTWKHPVHEVIAGPDATCFLSELVIIHQPDKTKDRGYMLDMMQQWHEAEPDDARLTFYLGREYCVRQQRDQAVETLWEYIDHPRAWAPEMGEAYILLGNLATGDDREELYWNAVAMCPARREPYVYLSRHFAKERAWPRAWSMCVMADAHTNQGIYTTHPWAWGKGWLTHKHLVGSRVGISRAAITKTHTS